MDARDERASGDRSRQAALVWWRLLAALGVVFVVSDRACAWGPAVHVWIGDAVLSAFALSVPVVAKLLRRHAASYLYGAIAPDFFVGKGSGGHDEHCHNWAAGHRLLEAAEDEAGRAFALGYLSHLSADVIGHNHFVPNYLYRSFGLRKLGHLYWEMHADNLLPERYVHQSAALIVDPERERHDVLLERVVDRSPVPLRARKKLFAAYLRLNSHRRARALMERLRPYSAHSLRYDDIGAQIELSLALVVTMLEDPSVPLLGRYDPVGAHNIREAKRRRRRERRAGAFAKDQTAFPIPEELLALRDRLERADAPIPHPIAEARVGERRFVS